jgi:hypothetical protein
MFTYKEKIYQSFMIRGVPTLVENMVKKTRSRFLIAVILTTLICSQ